MSETLRVTAKDDYNIGIYPEVGNPERYSMVVQCENKTIYISITHDALINLRHDARSTMQRFNDNKSVWNQNNA